MPEYDREAAAEQQESRTKELTDKLQAGVKELYDSDKYKNYLKSMSHFHNYSSRNIMLISIQKPGATRVASFKVWKEKFNRNVKKSEKGLYIYAPINGKTPEVKLMEKLDPETGAPLLDKDGKVIMEEMTELTNGMKFRLVPVFDVSQTHGDPLPELVEDISGNVAHYGAFVDALKAVSPLPIEFEPMRENRDGYCRYGEKIGIREGMSETQTISAIVHEITHATLHSKENAAENAEPKPTKVREIEAESISYVVCQRYNIETSPNSFGYLAEYGSRDMSELTSSLDTIRREASSLITAIDERFGVICKERGIDLAAKEPEQPIIPAETPEPSYTTESRTETIAGVDFEFAEVVPTQVAPDIIIPDPAIGFAERDSYGYTQEDMLPSTTERAIELFDNDLPVYLLYPDSTEAMAYHSDEIKTHDGIFGVERDDWLNSKEYKALSEHEPQTIEANLEADFLNANGDSFAIYQIKDSFERARDYRFEGLDYLVLQ